jgi:acyl-coenzyme A thioesterase PaaI-like protein
MADGVFQDDLAAIGFAHCWGCGSQNEHGLHVRSHWQGDEAISTWTPQPYHVASPGILSGGIIATIMDCHCAATACAAAYRAQNRSISADDPQIYVTAGLNVTYLRPTPSTAPVTLRAHVVGQDERRITVACSLYAGETECARAEVVTARVPSTWHAA